VTAPAVSRRLGSGPSLYVVLISGALTSIVIGLTTSWQLTWVMFLVITAGGMLWNVITVSLRQTIIPDHLLGRVNSVYRFFGWGTMPLGSALGGALVWFGESIGDRAFALRLPWYAVGVAYLAVFAYAAPRLTTVKMDAARAEGMAARQPRVD
jgi:MFS family permease